MAQLGERSLKLLHGKNFGFIATLNRDGSPQVSPVWIDTDGKCVLVNTAIGRVKERNLRRDPRVAIAISMASDPYRWTLIRGKVSEWIEGDEADRHIDKLAKKYTGAERFVRANQRERRVILKISPKQVTARDD